MFMRTDVAETKTDALRKSVLHRTLSLVGTVFQDAGKCQHAVWTAGLDAYHTISEILPEVSVLASITTEMFRFLA